MLQFWVHVFVKKNWIIIRSVCKSCLLVLFVVHRNFDLGTVKIPGQVWCQFLCDKKILHPWSFVSLCGQLLCQKQARTGLQKGIVLFMSGTRLNESSKQKHLYWMFSMYQSIVFFCIIDTSLGELYRYLFHYFDPDTSNMTNLINSCIRK